MLGRNLALSAFNYYFITDFFTFLQGRNNLKKIFFFKCNKRLALKIARHCPRYCALSKMTNSGHETYHRGALLKLVSGTAITQNTDSVT